MNDYINSAQEKLNIRLAEEESFGFVVKFNIDDKGVIYIDGHPTPPVAIQTTDMDVDVTISATPDTMKDMFAGTLNPATAYMTGKLRVTGNMAAAMKLAQII